MSTDSKSRGEEYGVVHRLNRTARSLLDFLVGELGVEIERAKFLVDLGSIYVDGQRERNPLAVLGAESEVRAHLEPRRFKVPGLKDRIVESRPGFYVVDKPSGLPTHALVDNAKENLIVGLGAELREELFITHRLDVETGGLIVIARNKVSQSEINASIASRKIRRSYIAFVENEVETGTKIHYLEPSPKAPKRVSKNPVEGWLRCELVVKSCRAGKYLESYSGFEVEIELVTGRAQQIRAQLSELGSPILGDMQYGSKHSFTDPSTDGRAIALRAKSLSGLP
ncbi:MAG: RNA pseudouridine synthase [Bdellovibrionota bacterium]